MCVAVHGGYLLEGLHQFHENVKVPAGNQGIKEHVCAAVYFLGLLADLLESLGRVPFLGSKALQ